MARSRRIVIATRNGGKLREIRAALPAPVATVVGLDEVDPAGRITEAPEDEPTFAANARAKAAYYARATGLWALADDSGLEVDALDGAPGPRSARYAADAGDAGSAAGRDAANNARLLRDLAGVPDPERTARFVCCLALSDGDRTLLEARGVLAGRIGLAPQGRNGFGYDPLFVLPARGCTVAELTADQKNAISHRGQAVRAFAEALGRSEGDRPCPT